MIKPVLFNEILKEITFKNSLSSGKGGQHVNKVSTKVSLFWNIKETVLIDDVLKEKIKSIFPNKINSEGIYAVSSDESRYMLQNKKSCLRKLKSDLDKLFHVPKARKKSSPTKASIEKRLNEKKWKSILKQNRKYNF